MSGVATYRKLGHPGAELDSEQALRRPEFHAYRALAHALDKLAEIPLTNTWALASQRKRVAVIRQAWAARLAELDASL